MKTKILHQFTLNTLNYVRKKLVKLIFFFVDYKLYNKFTRFFSKEELSQEGMLLQCFLTDVFNMIRLLLILIF